MLLIFFRRLFKPLVRANFIFVTKSDNEKKNLLFIYLTSSVEYCNFQYILDFFFFCFWFVIYDYVYIKYIDIEKMANNDLY